MHCAAALSQVGEQVMLCGFSHSSCAGFLMVMMFGVWFFDGDDPGMNSDELLMIFFAGDE